MIINTVALSDFLLKSKLTIKLFLHLKSRFKVEVEQYFLESGNVTMLSIYFFNTFEEAKNFATQYNKPYYRIVLYEQGEKDNFQCNFETGAWLTRSDQRKFNYVKDRYGFKGVLGVDPHGWYLRGLNTHNPEFAEVADDMQYMLMEVKRRFYIGNGKIDLEDVIPQVFSERHPLSQARYAKSFDSWAQEMIANEVIQKIQVLMSEGKEIR